VEKSRVGNFLKKKVFPGKDFENAKFNKKNMGETKSW
jgi:hypothetical protein